MPESTHIYTGPSACGCIVDGVRHTVLPGDRVAFGPDDLDARAADRLGEHFIPLSEYVPPSDAVAPEVVGVLSGPVWARVTVAELAALADGFEAFSKPALASLCRIGGLSSSGSVADLRDRLFVDLEASEVADERAVDGPVFSSIDDIDRMDPEFGMSPEVL